MASLAAVALNQILVHGVYKLTFINHYKSNRPAHAFTLIELLVVIIIFSVLLGAIGLSVAPQAQRRNETEAERLRQLFIFAEEEARQTGHAMRWVSSSSSVGTYQFMRQIISPAGEVSWLQIGKPKSEEVLRPRTYESSPLKIWLREQVESVESLGASSNARFRDQTEGSLVINFSVDDTNAPFQLVLQYPDTRTVITSDGLGDYKITNETKPS